MVSGCLVEPEQEAGSTVDPLPVDTPRVEATPERIRESEAASGLASEDQTGSEPGSVFEPEPLIVNGPAPGGAGDCLSGLRAFVVDYVTPSGRSRAGGSASGLCFDEIDSLINRGGVVVDDRWGGVEPGSIAVFVMALFPLDKAGEECSAVYGLACKRR